ncbi:hypothetical protein DXG03_004986 [Asterophora parasitica]|uniref:Septin-type G domain-containing protein n=1 Tax=Asterophora parasitica TaxID=117018 RepID=A0A9P7GJY2_9AGAR|nr:hypothetical protein DXG03_004986 [Asterophora parasitica]
MFSFRRKPRKEPDTAQIRTSPSLPELNSQGIPWPENLVDVTAIQRIPASDIPQQGAATSSFQGVAQARPFHKPFRDSPGKHKDGGPISSLYMSSPPSAFDNRRSGTPTVGRYSQRRARVPPTFNLMVVGGKGTGKTSLLRLLLDTADISPAATIDQRAALDRFLRGSTKATQSIETACVEICESRFDRVLLSVIDTPGLDFLEGKELKLERQINGVIKYVDAQFADTMSEESKVIRKNRGDQHIHVCIYMIDPSTIITAAERRALSTLPHKTRSETTVSNSTPPDLVPDTSSGDDSDDEAEGPLTMSPAEIRVIRRLAARTNILPVVAHSDSLTDEKLRAVKLASTCPSMMINISHLTSRPVRTGLAAAGIDFGVFEATQKPPQPTRRRQTQFADTKGDDADHAATARNGDTAAGEQSDEEEEERQARPVIKLRSSRHANGRALSRSRSRRDLTIAAEDNHRPLTPDATDRESVANVRFSAHVLAKNDVSEDFPFALIAPERGRRRQRPDSSDSDHAVTSLSSPDEQQQHQDEESVPPTPASAHSVKLPYLHAPPEDLKGVFIRKFRWGTIDVLDPTHCDFAALRTAVLSTHLKVGTTSQLLQVCY